MEKQSNCFLNLFYYFLFVSCLTLCLPAHCVGAAAPTETTEYAKIFTPGENKINKKGDSGTQERYEHFTSPVLAYVNNMLVVFAQAKNITQEGQTKCDIVEGHITFDNVKNDGKFDDKFAATLEKHAITENKDKDCAGSPTVVVKDEKQIYVFFKTLTGADSSWKYSLIKNKIEGQDAKKIKWEDKKVEDLKDHFSALAGGSEKYIAAGSGGSGTVSKDTIVVPVGYKDGKSDNFSTIINLSTSDENEWKFVSSTSAAEGINPAIAELDGKLIMMTSNKEGYRKVYESVDIGTKWKEAFTSLSGVWGNTKKRDPNTYSGQSGFITAKIVGNKNVILFTQTVANNKDSKYKLHLWVTDNKRVSLA